MRAEQAEAIRIDGHYLKVTRPEKILFPDDAITKGDLVRYYERIGLQMLPYLKGRPLALQRYPDGISGPGFFQKAAASYYPAWIETATVKKAGGTVKHVVCNNLATLVYLANQACITLHTWLSRADRPDFPDQMIFDLDPSADDFASVVAGAQALKEILDDLKLPAYLKTTGSRGLHIAVPLDGERNFDSVRAVARKVAEMVVARDPGRFTLEQHKNKRAGRVFVDINRNAYAQTAAAVYCVRARNGAPVSAPLDWAELHKKNLRPDASTIKNLFDRIDQIPDPWLNFWKRRASLDEAARKLGSHP